MWLKSALLICCAVASTLGDERIATKLRPSQAYANIQSAHIEAVTFRDRSIPIEGYVSSRKSHAPVSKYAYEEDEYYGEDEEEEEIKSEKIQSKKVPERLESTQKKQPSFKDIDKANPKKQTRVELENFSDTGVLHEDGIKKVDSHRTQIERQRDSVIPGVYVSNEYPTTMLPILTTPREVRSFDFIPVNIIREDNKDAYTPYADRKYGDLSDVSLVPAGTSSRIQVKKGPNGKDYEYEYVYYYYDEDDEGKASSASNSHDIPNRTTPSPRRGASNSNRSKYTNVDRPTTVEPASNEVIPNRNRGRQLAEADEISEERLPTNTRFPPRSRSNHNTGTTEPSRVRGNRPRPSLELVDSSSFRTHQDGPEFPPNLPKGPVRFIGVTPNEDNEEKASSRNRARPNRVQEPAPVEESVQDLQPIFRRRPVSNTDPEAQVELNRGQPVRQSFNEDDGIGSTTSAISHHDKKLYSSEKQDAESSDFTTTDNPTTEYPSAMDKVALDLYAFLQQGQNNLVDTTSDVDSSSDSTTQLEDDDTTELITTTEPVSTTVVTTESTTTSTEPSTTSTTTTEPTTSATTTTGRGKFRRPGIPGGPISRNRFKPNGGSTSTTESSNAPSEPTQKVRGRFGSNGNGGFKRPRPGQKQPVDEEIHKENSASSNAEKPNGNRNRFRGTGTRNIPATTPGPSSTSSSGSSSATNSAASRPTFNKLNINRRRGRPSTAAPAANEETPEGSDADAHDGTTTPKTSLRPKLPGVVPRPVRPGNRVNLRPRPGQAISTTLAPEPAEVPVDEPASEGTEEETHEAPAESSPPNRLTTVNPLNKLRNRNRLQVQPKTTTKSPISATPRRSPLLPRRKTTETPIEESVHEQENEEDAAAETEPTEATIGETSTAASTRHEEVRGLGGLLAPRRRIAPRRPGQIISRE